MLFLGLTNMCMCVGEEYQQLELVMCPINLPTNVCKLLPENYFSSCQTVEPYVFPLKLWEKGLQIKSGYHWHKTRDAQYIAHLCTCMSGMCVNCTTVPYPTEDSAN